MDDYEVVIMGFCYENKKVIVTIQAQEDYVAVKSAYHMPTMPNKGTSRTMCALAMYIR